MNKGTKINEILKVQGFNHHDYGRTSSYSTSTGLRIMVHAYTSNATHFIIDDDDDGTYTISTGLKPSHTVLTTGVAEKTLKDTFEKEIAKNVK